MDYQPWLTTLEYVRRHRTMATGEVVHDELLKDFIYEASQELIAAIARIPHPFVETRRYDFAGRNMPDPWTLLLDADLLAASTLTNGDASTIASTDYVLDPPSDYPKHKLRLKLGKALTFTWADTPEQAIALAGIWGYAPQYPAAWKQVTTITEDLDTTETGVDVAVGAAIETGHYLLVDAEQMFVTAGAGTTTLTVERGANGTTAATHLSAAPVKVYQQLRDIAGAVAEMAAYYYKTLNRTGGAVRVLEGNTVIVEDMDPRVQATINRHYRMTISSSH